MNLINHLKRLDMIRGSSIFNASTKRLFCAWLILFIANQAVAQGDHYDQLPDLGSQAANFLSEADSSKLGKAFIRHSRYQQAYVYDPELVSYINRLGQRLLESSADAGKDYNFYLIDNTIINAFAVPGGHIAMHTGILTKSESEGELASVIAHEISHVTQRHIARKLETSKYDSWLALGAILAAAAAGGSDAAQAAFSLANASILERQLSYSRDFEAEADSLGIRLLSRAGFAPSAMPRFFKRLLDESRINESHAPEFLRSHPLTLNRIAESHERVRAYPEVEEVAQNPDESEFLLMQAKATAGYAKNHEQVRDMYLARLKQGKVTLPNRYGYALSLAENGEHEAAREKYAALLKDYPNNLTLKLSNADNELYAKEIKTGLALLKAAYLEEVARGNHLVDIYYANSLVLSEHFKEAIPILRSAIANNKNEPYFHILLSRAYGESGDDYRAFLERGEYHYLQGNYEFSLKQFTRAKTFTESSYELARMDARIEDVNRELEEIKKL